MKLSKNISKKKFIIITIMFLIFFFILNNFDNRDLITPSPKELTTYNTEVLPASYGLPIRIEIPKIGINSTVEPIGLTLDGTVGSPIGPNEVAWFSEGPIPGSMGNAIMNGHSGWRNNTPAVFDNLEKLKKGDKIYVEDKKGVVTTFIVKELKIYDKDDEALDVFNSSDGKSHLNLITCTGLWNVIENGREDRIVVFTDLIEIE